jgi:hypothetical protein
MRTLRSVVAVVSTALIMACQTAASTGMNQAPTPVSTIQGYQSAASAPSAVAVSASKATAPVAAEGGSKKTWIIVALVAAIAVVVVILASGGSGGGGIY